MKRSKLSLSNYKLLSADMGKLVPIGLYEVLPGDTVQQNTSLVVRLAPLLAPIMHPVICRVHHWFVPNRLIWDDWEDFITGSDTSITPPTLTSPVGGYSVGSLHDYFGIPPGVAGAIHSALPARAYASIYNEFYRDEDLQDEAVISTLSGEDSTTSVDLLSPCWEKDYFTSARPWPQKGDAVTLPLGQSAPVKTGSITGGTALSILNGADAYKRMNSDASFLEIGSTNGEEASALYADLAAAEGVTINDLREAFALQRFAEARAQYGSRYTEYLRYLGVTSSDARLQRPEYLGGGTQTIQFSEIVQTGPDSTDEGVATLRGHGIGAMRSNRFRRFIEEHGFIVTLMSVRPKTIYTDGLSRMWSRSTYLDYYQKELATIGQQEILNKEVRLAHSAPDGTFGYQDRYDEYRRIESTISGEFRDILNYWHMSRSFASDPALNSSFVTCNPTTRIFAATENDPLYVMARHSIQARRPLSAKAFSGIM